MKRFHARLIPPAGISDQIDLGEFDAANEQRALMRIDLYKAQRSSLARYRIVIEEIKPNERRRA